MTLDNAIGYSTVPGPVASYLKNANIYKTHVAGIEAVRADKEDEPRGQGYMTEVVFFKGNDMYRITVTGDKLLMAIDNILNTLQLVKGYYEDSR